MLEVRLLLFSFFFLALMTFMQSILLNQPTTKRLFLVTKVGLHQFSFNNQAVF